MSKRKDTFCPVCHISYKDKAHLRRCFPDADEAAINLIHKNEKDAIAAFTSGRLVSYATLAGWMKDAGVSIIYLQQTASLLRRAGHVVRGPLSAVQAALMAAATPLPPGGGVPAAAASKRALVDDAMPSTSTAVPMSKRALVDDGAMPSTATAAPTSKRVKVVDGAMPSKATAAPTSKRVKVVDGAMPSKATTAPASKRAKVVDGTRKSKATTAPASKRALIDDGAMPSTSTAAPRVGSRQWDVELAFTAAFPLGVGKIPGLAAARNWLTTIDVAANMSTTPCDHYVTAKGLISFWRQLNIPHVLNAYYDGLKQ